MQIRNIIFLLCMSYGFTSNLYSMNMLIVTGKVLAKNIEKGTTWTIDFELKDVLKEYIAPNLYRNDEYRKIIVNSVVKRLETYKKNSGSPLFPPLLNALLCLDATTAQAITKAAASNINNLGSQKLGAIYSSFYSWIIDYGSKKDAFILCYKDFEELSKTWLICEKIITDAITTLGDKLTWTEEEKLENKAFFL